MYLLLLICSLSLNIVECKIKYVSEILSLGIPVVYVIMKVKTQQNLLARL